MKLTRFLARLLLLLLLCPALPAVADEASFFLLSDASYGSHDQAMVRLEAQNLGAIAQQGGVDVYVYRVSKPLEFLQAQKNLHRIDVTANHVGEGLANVLANAWDRWWNEARRWWRKLFSSEARSAVTALAPEVRSHPQLRRETPAVLNPEYKPLKSHTLVDSFRYPVQLAQPIKPPKGVALAGSSSNFTTPRQGNVLVPIGQREPGLYIVEAMVGSHRAVTMVFVSDSVAVTKVSGEQMLVWATERSSGRPVAGAKAVWSDGVGVLASGKTDRQGLLTFTRRAPEKTYLYGEDAQGGVFVAENFYYDSEIYNTKLYAVTDRPLYRPGETVFVKFHGRTFVSARQSKPVAAGDIQLQVFDANGFPLASRQLKLHPQSGGASSFTLPDNAVAGGYELRFSYRGEQYGAAFRVAEYQKPHFEINVLPDKREFKTHEPVSGRLQLVYPNGKPVAHARIDLSVRAQRLTMVEGDLAYAGEFPLRLSNVVLTTDAKGVAQYTLPPATEPSRYILSVLATDGAAYRVRATKEILVERGAGTYAVRAARSFSSVNETVDFHYELLPLSQTAGNPPAVAAKWEWVKLENRQRDSGSLNDGNALSLRFAEPGTYTLTLRDSADNIVGATTHFVSGEGVRAPQGSIVMVFDKPQYKPGEVASALLTFSQDVEQALFTLERDKVEKTALMTQGSGWLSAEQLAPRQWRVRIPVRAEYGPNMTFSVAYVKNGDYVFQNLGMKVELPRVMLDVKASKAVYAPGERVTLDLGAMLGGKPARGSVLTVSVVDEMVYVLQPEIAPNIFDFFYHPRRNNVRTSASLNFIAYDLAMPPSGQAGLLRRQAPQRAIKILERPRREDKDTAFWQPELRVDKYGRAKVSFVMPDSLTRWRVTVRAVAPGGEVGQGVAYLQSEKDFYLKWTSPNWLRAQDAPLASVAIFNRDQQEATVVLGADGAGLARRDTLKLKPGVNFVSLPLVVKGREAQVKLSLSVQGKTIDALTVPLKVVPQNMQSPRSLSVPLVGSETALPLPTDARNVRLQFADNASSQFRRLIDDLIDYPYGCVEQTASRLIPYSLALRATLPGEEKLQTQLRQRLNSYRFRLAQMAGPEATFGWWRMPEQGGDAWMTAYAYYADWHASAALKLALPAGHFDRLLEVYRKQGVKLPHWQRALMLDWMQEMGLPVRSLAEALAEEVFKPGSEVKTPAEGRKVGALGSLVLGQERPALQVAMSRVLVGDVVRRAGGQLPAGATALNEVAVQRLRDAESPLAEALLLLTGKRNNTEISAVLDKVRAEAPTIDRTLILLWSYRALGGRAGGDHEPLLRSGKLNLTAKGGWQMTTSSTGQRVFRWPEHAPPPNAIKLGAAPKPGVVAVAQYESSEPEKSRLPVRVQRTLYRLVPVSRSPQGADGGEAASGKFDYVLEPVNGPLLTTEVYLDEITLSRQSGPVLRYGIVEVPLPPGMVADRATWGIHVRQRGSKKTQPLEGAQYEQTPRGYSVPVETLDSKVVIRHLVRPAQSGKFVLPPVRYYRMYQPEDKAFEARHRALEIR